MLLLRRWLSNAECQDVTSRLSSLVQKCSRVRVILNHVFSNRFNIFTGFVRFRKCRRSRGSRCALCLRDGQCTRYGREGRKGIQAIGSEMCRDEHECVRCGMSSSPKASDGSLTSHISHLSYSSPLHMVVVTLPLRCSHYGQLYYERHCPEIFWTMCISRCTVWATLRMKNFVMLERCFSDV